MPDLKNTVIFGLNFLKNPLRNASLVPSSAQASREMVKNIDFSKISTIVELGPGTGVFTREIIKHCRPDARIILIELEETYIPYLTREFGQRAAVEQVSAHLLDSVLAKHGISQVDLIISGLPFTVPDKEVLFNSIQRHCKQGTTFRFFTYLPFIMKRVYSDLPVRKVSFVAGNFPPLWVYGIN